MWTFNPFKGLAIMLAVFIGVDLLLLGGGNTTLVLHAIRDFFYWHF